MRTKCDLCGWYHFNPNDHIIDRDGPLPVVHRDDEPVVQIDERILRIYYHKLLAAIRRA